MAVEKDAPPSSPPPAVTLPSVSAASVGGAEVQQEERKVREYLRSLSLPETAVDAKIADVRRDPETYAENKACGRLARAILGVNAPPARSRPVPVPKSYFNGNCDNCGKRGHRAKDCKEAKSEYRVDHRASPEVKAFDRLLKDDEASISSLCDAELFVNGFAKYALSNSAEMLWRMTKPSGLRRLSDVVSFGVDAAAYKALTLKVLSTLSLKSLQNRTFTLSINTLYMALYRTPGLLDVMIEQTNRETADLICTFAIAVTNLLADARDDIVLRNLETKLVKLRCGQVARLSRLLRPDDAPGKRSNAIARPGGRHDNDHADYRRVGLIPTPGELAVKVTAPYLPLDADANRFLEDDEAHLLDKQFRLLREDLVGPLKQKLADTLGKPTDLLHSAQFVDADLFPKACIHLRFQVPKKMGAAKDKEEYWEESRLLQYGTVVGLFQEGSDPLFGRVVDRDSKRLAKEQTIGLLFEDLTTPLRWIKDASKSSMYLVEISASFFSYEPILKCLQQMDSVPFADEIVHMKPSQKIKYVGPAAANLDKAMASELGKHDFDLDDSQQNAVSTALENRVSLIQGPPGTGKSFIGELIAKALLEATDKKILCVCFTNHALDQFLEALHKGGERNMVRLGNSSKNETVKEYELRNLTKKVAFDPETKKQWYLINEEMHALEAAFHQFKGFMAMDDLIWRRANEFLKGMEDKATEAKADSPELLCQFALPQSTPGFQVVGPTGKELKPDDIWYRWKTGGDPYPGMHGGTLWALAPVKRETLLRAWLNELKQAEAERCAGKMKEHQRLTKMRNEIRNLDDRRVLEQARVIGCTTHGAATRKEMLQLAGAKILIVEEAAEVLEAHVLTSIGRSIEHIIMIGDHKQLRPKVDCYKLRIEAGKGYGLNRSLFERMVDSGFKLSTLTQQHRMRPEISSLVRSLTYPELVDGSTVKRFPPLKGTAGNVIFINHTEEETKARDAQSELGMDQGKSKSNTHEAQMCANMVKYFLQQGYKPSQLVVLATYKDQLKYLQRFLAGCQLDTVLGDLDLEELEADGDSIDSTQSCSAQSIRVATVDNYQGEEADVVIASFVRSNRDGIVGHLNETRRINVLLSRARHGLVMIGNMHTMLEASRKHASRDPDKTQWDQLFDVLRVLSPSAVSDGFPAICQQHPEKKTRLMKTPKDFNDKCPDGGCTEACGFVFKCGHTCPKKCHPMLDRQHDNIAFRCVKPAMHTCEHCSKQEPVECWRIQKKEFDKCKGKCQSKLDCGHDCPSRCHPPTDGAHAALAMKCTQIMPQPCEECSTLLPAECWQVSQNVVDPCTAKCRHKLDCGHDCPLSCHPLSDGLHARLAFQCTEVRLHNCTECKMPDVVECWRVQKKDFEKCRGCANMKAIERDQLARLAHAKQEKHKRHAEKEAQRLGKKRYLPFKKEELKKSGASFEEYYRIEDRVMKYMQQEHGFIRVVKIEKVHNDKLVHDWFKAKASMADPGKDPRLLFHGTSAEATNGIAKDGFRLPPKGQGNMFGQGIYLATDSTKSANPLYTKGSNRLLVCDTLLGSTCAVEGWSKPFPLSKHMKRSSTGSNSGRNYLDVDLASVRREGFDSVFAPRNCSGAGGVKFDEMIVYDPKLVLPKYIVHFSDSRGGAAAATAGGARRPSKPRLHTLASGDAEYSTVKQRFVRSMGGSRKTIVKIEKLVNAGLLAAYNTYRDCIVAPGNKGDANEKWMFHGTDAATVKKLSTGSNQCFDRSFTTTHAFGKGVYFARDAAYSASPSYSKLGPGGQQQMFCARVVVGVPTAGRSSMTSPPERDGPSCTRYDSTVDNVANPSIVVVYNDAAAYPEFIITFR